MKNRLIIVIIIIIINIIIIFKYGAFITRVVFTTGHAYANLKKSNRFESTAYMNQEFSPFMFPMKTLDGQIKK